MIPNSLAIPQGLDPHQPHPPAWESSKQEGRRALVDFPWQEAESHRNVHSAGSARWRRKDFGAGCVQMCSCSVGNTLLHTAQFARLSTGSWILWGFPQANNCCAILEPAFPPTGKAQAPQLPFWDPTTLGSPAQAMHLFDTPTQEEYKMQ